MSQVDVWIEADGIGIVEACGQHELTDEQVELIDGASVQDFEEWDVQAPKELTFLPASCRSALNWHRRAQSARDEDIAMPTVKVVR